VIAVAIQFDGLSNCGTVYWLTR